MFTSTQPQVPSPAWQRARVRGIKKSGSFFDGQCRRDVAGYVSTGFSHFHVLCFFLLLSWLPFHSTVYATDFSPARRLGISLTTLQKSLEKVGSPVTFAPRPGSTQGTQEARLPENIGMVQAGGGNENLAVVILWLPVDKAGHFAGPQARVYLKSFTETFISDSEPVSLWIDEVLKRAVADSASGLHLESQLFDKYQLKATYIPTLNPPMMSLAITASSDE